MKTAATNSHRSLAEAIVRAQAEDMIYIGGIVAAARKYPDDAGMLDWRRAMQTAASVRTALDHAESLLRADHTTDRKAATGASQQAAA